MAGETQTSKDKSETSPVVQTGHAAFYRERDANGNFPPRTEQEALRLKGEIARWAALMGLRA